MKKNKLREHLNSGKSITVYQNVEYKSFILGNCRTDREF